MTNREIPTVVLVTERFVALAKLVMDSRGISNQPSVLLPGNPEFVGDDELRAMAAEVIGDVVALIQGVAVRK